MALDVGAEQPVNRGLHREQLLELVKGDEDLLTAALVHQQREVEQAREPLIGELGRGGRDLYAGALRPGVRRGAAP